MTTFTISTNESKQILDITDQVQEQISDSKTSGVVHLYILHTTAALTVADLDPGTDKDIMDALIEMVPGNDVMQYRHSHNPEHTPDHILSALVGPSISVPVEQGSLVLGTWQHIILCEFDGPRERQIDLRILGAERC